ncbi:hypothetical protein ROZALSC1DRAFT_28166 [Rozella allomycis CSF55]|uniref:Uncharacterized protein n=1 Tax=Rozella allomycis (strain CSF55) TaxID=988480 RepID=A0A4P9YL34_ROZAC|nr:hypothetical protein ROZALSC1DRAFT_28166 [Rozella allomycis CSF55]
MLRKSLTATSGASRQSTMFKTSRFELKDVFVNENIDPKFQNVNHGTMKEKTATKKTSESLNSLAIFIEDGQSDDLQNESKVRISKSSSKSLSIKSPQGYFHIDADCIINESEGDVQLLNAESPKALLMIINNSKNYRGAIKVMDQTIGEVWMGEEMRRSVTHMRPNNWNEYQPADSDRSYVWATSIVFTNDNRAVSLGGEGISIGKRKLNLILSGLNYTATRSVKELKDFARNSINKVSRDTSNICLITIHMVCQQEGKLSVQRFNILYGNYPSFQKMINIHQYNQCEPGPLREILGTEKINTKNFVLIVPSLCNIKDNAYLSLTGLRTRNKKENPPKKTSMRQSTLRLTNQPQNVSVGSQNFWLKESRWKDSRLALEDLDTSCKHKSLGPKLEEPLAQSKAQSDGISEVIELKLQLETQKSLTAEKEARLQNEMKKVGNLEKKINELKSENIKLKNQLEKLKIDLSTERETKEDEIKLNYENLKENFLIILKKEQSDLKEKHEREETKVKKELLEAKLELEKVKSLNQELIRTNRILEAGNIPKEYSIKRKAEKKPTILTSLAKGITDKKKSNIFSWFKKFKSARKEKSKEPISYRDAQNIPNRLTLTRRFDMGKELEAFKENNHTAKDNCMNLGELEQRRNKHVKQENVDEDNYDEFEDEVMMINENRLHNLRTFYASKFEAENDFETENNNRLDPANYFSF